MLKKLLALMACVIILCSYMAVCSAEQQAEQITATDYSDKSNWLALPEITKKADTIYIYPTAFIDTSEGAPDFCTIDNEMMRITAASCYDEQTPMFAEVTNVFAPFYRQVNMKVAAVAPADVRKAILQREPKTDLFAAFDYYFENLNDGRPYIIAGHSQGSQMMTYILSEYMAKHPEYLERMIAAYAIGYSITKTFLEENPHLRFAEGADDTGVIISWNTEGEGNAHEKNFVVEEGAISINPLNWKRDETYAGKEECLGALIKDPESGTDKMIPGAADAQLNLERGVVVTHTDVVSPEEPAWGFGPDSYHTVDYRLFYKNVENNVKTRVDHYFSEHAATDYSDTANWFQFPEITKDVDTFFIYPTCYMPTEADAPLCCTIDDEGMRKRVEKTVMRQAGVFSESTNVFVPFYRQYSINALGQYDGDGAAEILKGEPCTDIYAALDYYFEKVNDGRPFILAGHSQGSMVLRIVLKEYMAQHPEYYERMVAAYALGYSITEDDLKQHPWLKFAESAEDTGVIISWNTEGPDNEESSLVLPGAISINPINWKRDETYASADENLGSVVSGQTVTPGVADARVDQKRGVVICTNTDLPYFDTSKLASTPLFGTKSFHLNDYSFYYENIRQNVADRIEAYFRQMELDKAA